MIEGDALDHPRLSGRLECPAGPPGLSLLQCNDNPEATPDRPDARRATARPPKLIYTLLEGRGLLEMASLPFCLPLLQATPRGDGHPVLLVPGFAASDATLVGLRVFLRSRGYHVETWGFGQNTGFQRKFTQALEQKLRHMHHRHERKVSVVVEPGRRVMRSTPRTVPRSAYAAWFRWGGPMRVTADTDQVPLPVKALYRYFAHPMGPVAHVSNVRARLLRAPPPVPSACICPRRTASCHPTPRASMDRLASTKTSGSRQPSRPGFNAAVMWVLADRLSQPEGAWQPV